MICKMKYIWVSSRLGTVFETESLGKDHHMHKTHWLVTYLHERGHGPMNKAWLADDIKCGSVAVWSGTEYMKLKYGRWVIHKPKDETI